MSIKVKAIAMGFYGGVIRNVGTVFEVKDKDDLGKWMVKVDDEGKINNKPETKAEKAAREAAEKAAAEEAAAKAAAIGVAEAALAEATAAGDEEGIAKATAELAALQPSLV